MAIVEIEILSTKHSLMCEAGQESYLESLANDLDNRLQSLKQSYNGSSDTKLLVLTSLMILSELNDLKSSNNDKSCSEDSSISDKNKTIFEVASRIESLVKKLEGS